MSKAVEKRQTGLARALSKLGYCSRAQAFGLIRAGRVTLNGKGCRDPEAPVRLPEDRIRVDGQAIAASQLVYLMLNKPRGLVTTAADEKGRKTVYDCLPPDLPWLAPVGRLDKASEGLLLLTNDSEWAAGILAPESRLVKTYHVQIGIVADQTLLAAMLRGLSSGGDYLRVGGARILRHGLRNSWLEVKLREGKNRHIRRLLEHLGVQVLRLLRVAIGPLELGDLAKGSFRALTAAEKQALDSARALPRR